MKIGTNDIYLAEIIYSLLIITVLILVLSTLLGRSIKKDFAQIELFNRAKNQLRLDR